MPSPQETPITVTLPTPLDEAGRGIWATILNAAIGVITTAINFILSLFGMQGVVYVDSFTGANDDAKLAAAAAYVQARTIKPAMALSPRVWSFTQQITWFSGFRLVCPGGGAPDQVRGSNPNPCQANLAVGSSGNIKGWLVQPNGNTFGVHISGIAFQGNQYTRFIEPNGSAVLWTSTITGSWNLFKSVFGSTSQQMLMNASSVIGWMNTNNGYDQAWNIGGSDCSINLDARSLIDSPTGTITGGTTGQNTHVKLTSLSKTSIGPLYITGERVRPMEISSGSGGLTITAATLEGRNAGAPSYGAIVKGTNAQFALRDCHLNFGMADPATQGYGDKGIVHLTGASTNVLIDGCWYDRATGVGEEVPFIYIDGGRLVARNAMPVGFTGKPVIKRAGGTVYADDTFTVLDLSDVYNTWSGVPDGTALSSANALAGGAVPDLIDTTGGTITGSTAMALGGTRCLKFSNTSNADTKIGWIFTATRQAAFSWTLGLLAAPTAGTRIATILSTTPSTYCAILLGADRKLSIQNNAGTTIATTTNALATNQPYRLELLFDNSGGSAAGALQLKTFAGVGSTSEDTNLGLAVTGQAFGGSNAGWFYQGRNTGSAAAGDIYMSRPRIKADSTSFIGPW